MRKSTSQFMLVILLAFQTFIPSLWAQSPQKMSYQAVVRNSSDQLVTNKLIGMRISILNGSESGTAVYSETQKSTTNANGLVTVEIGTGNSIDIFSAIDWTTGPYFIKTETDPSGGTSYTISGISELLSVPYALHARTVEIDNVNDADADPANEIQTLSISGTSLTLSKGGLTVTLPSSGGGDNWGTQTVATNATLEGNGSTATPLKIAKQAATNGQVLKWNGTTWAPGDDTSVSSGLTLPYTQTVANNDFAFSVTNSLNSSIKGSSSSNTGTGVYGYNSATFGFTNGVIGESYSVSGTGVYGKVTASDGFNTGVFGESASKAGTGVYGYNSASSGSNYGVQGIALSGSGVGVHGSSEGTGVYGFSTALTGFNYGVKGKSVSTKGAGVYGFNSTSTGHTQGVWGFVYSPDGTGVFGENASTTGFATGVSGTSVSEAGTGVYGVNGASTGEAYGVQGLSYSNSGSGVYGINSATTGTTYGVKGNSSSPEGLGVYGKAPNIGVKGVGSNIGVSGESSGSMGIGVHGVAPIYGLYGEGAYAVYGASTAEGGYGVFGSSISCGVRGFSGSETGIGVIGNNPSGSGYTFGVKGYAGSVNGTGVYGDGGQYGVYGESSTSDGTGVYGTSDSYGVRGTSTSSYGVGVYGWSAKYGIYGECPTPSGYAGYFSGHLAVTGNVGIGTTDPGYRLDVAGSINLNKGSTGSAIYCNDYEALGFDGGVFSWGFQSQYNYFARPVAIGTNDYTGYLLTVNGTAAKPGGGSWTTWSDIRLKDIQGNYEKGLKEIILLQPVKYNYKKDNGCKLPSDINYVGFVAQDVQKLFPEAVAEGKDGYLTLDVNSINVALVNAIKELNAENDELKERLIKLEKLMDANSLK